MGTLTTDGKNSMLNAFVSTEGTLYLALFDGAVEETGTGYTRKAITWDNASGGNKANSVAVEFANNGNTDWEAALDTYKIFDALTGGNELATGALAATRDMSIANATLTFNIGDIDLDLTDS